MNYLGHAYIARNHPELIAGNFAGDSYKGKIEKFSHLPAHIYNGIRLHRFIDDYTDSANEILEVGRILRKAGIDRVGLIAADILLDHFLSKNWHHYSTVDYPDFVDYVYRHTDSNLHHLESRFQFTYDKLKTYGWFFDYPTLPGIEKILVQFSKRISFENDLAKSAVAYDRNGDEIDDLFDRFMSCINSDAEKFIIDKLHKKS